MDKPAPTTEQLKSQWNTFAPSFSKELTRQTNVVAYQLLTQLQLHKDEVNRVVEMGCGAGGGTQLIAQLARPGVNIVALDLSTSFLDIARKQLEGKAQVEFLEGSAEELPLPDASFDRYAANYVLHLVTEPQQMLREARRVLRSGHGIAAFTVWGRQEQSPFWTLLPEVQRKAGLDVPEPTVRSNFHLNDPTKLRQMALDAGFSRAMAWYSVSAIDAVDASEAVVKYMASPMLNKLLSNTEESKRQGFMELLEKTIHEEYYAQGKPLAIETLYLVAYA